MGEVAQTVVAVGCWRGELSAAAWARAHEAARLTIPGTPNHLPAAAPPVPWLAVTPGAGIATLPREHVEMLGDFERCVFWTLAEVWP